MKPNQKYVYNLRDFREENEAAYYLLGVFMTDGCVSCRGTSPIRTSIDSVDTDWLEIIKDKLCSKLPIKLDRGYSRLNIYSKELGMWLLSKGCHPHKSLTLQMPNVPEKYLPDFVRGCIDGDGSISIAAYSVNRTNKTNGKVRTYSYTKRTCYLCSASPLFVEGIGKCLSKIGIKHSIFKHPLRDSCIRGDKVIGKNPLYSISFGDKTAYYFLRWAYYPEHQLSMPRKRVLANNVIAHYEQTIL